MPFTFKLVEPPCDVAFLSIVDGEALYNADNTRTRDVKEATIRQIGWHRITLPQEWFLSAKALETTRQVLETMQCTVQYLKYRGKNEEKRNAKLSASLRHCEEERAAAFEELIELRETVALYKKKLRELGQGTSRRDRRVSSAPLRSPRAGGLPCALCDNVYPSSHALESHYRKRHKRTAGYAAMAAASASVAQQQSLHTPPTAATTTTTAATGPIQGTLPFLHEAPRATGGGAATMIPAASDTRGDRSLREELSELRLTVAKLATQQAEFYRGLSPTCVAAVPLAGAPTANAPAAPTVSRVASSLPQSTAPLYVAASTGALPGLASAGLAGAEETALLRIQRELLHTSAELHQLQEAIERVGGSNGGQSAASATPLDRSERLSSPPPREVPAALPSHPTLDPRSFIRSSASDSGGAAALAHGGGGGSGGHTSNADTRRASTVDSLVVVSPMSPSPSMARHRRAGAAGGKTREKTRTPAAEAVVGRTSASGDLGDRQNTSMETQRPPASVPGDMSTPMGKGREGQSQQSTPQPLTAPSELNTRHSEDSDASSDESAFAATYIAAAQSTGNAKLRQAPETDSPRVRVHSSEKSGSHNSTDGNLVSANRYAAPRSDLTSPDNGAFPSNAPSSQPTASATAAVEPSSHTAAPLKTLFKSLSHTLLSKKTFGPVPSVPILRPPSPPQSSAASDSLPPTRGRGSHSPHSPSNGVPSASPSPLEAAPEESVVRHDGDEDMSTQHSSHAPHRGERSPTQTPRRGSTPPTSRVAQVPAINLSSVQSHSGTYQPQRSASPVLGRSAQRSTGGDDHADAVVRDSQPPHSFLAAAHKTIPVVRLVPPAPSDSAELRHDGGNSDVEGRQGGSLLEASYSIEALAYAPSSDDGNGGGAARAAEDTLLTSDDDALNAGRLNVYSSHYSEDSEEDVDVDQRSAPPSDEGDVEDSEAVMEDVLTDDVAQGPEFYAAAAAHTTPARVPTPESFTDRSAQDEAVHGGEARSLQDSASRDKALRPTRSSAAAAGAAAADGAEGRHAEQSPSDDYSYYSYSYSHSEAGSGEEDVVSEKDGGRGAELPSRETQQMSMKNPQASLKVSRELPPMGTSPMNNAGLATGGSGATAGLAANAAQEGISSPSSKKKKEKAKGVSTAHEPQMAPHQLPQVLTAEETGSDEMASVPGPHGASFQSSITDTATKARGVFKSIFFKKKKK